MPNVPVIGRLMVLEPSKVGPQHITLIEGYLKALLSVDLPGRGLDLVYRADPTSYLSLGVDTRAKIRHEAIAVTNSDKRRWIRKSLEEIGHVWRAVREQGPDDVLIITCLTSPALLLIELGNRLIGRKRVITVLHGEVEALFDPSIRSPKTWGFWSYQWSRLRRPQSKLNLAVIADFVRVSLETGFPAAFPAGAIRVLPFPIIQFEAAPITLPRHRIAFVGYKTRFKGYDVFEEMARQLSDAGNNADFVVIGDGVVENAVTGERQPFAAAAGFLGELAAASVAIFPYQMGYKATMSAAAIDTVATGVRLLATPLPCFIALGAEFGDDQVTLYDSLDELVAFISNSAYLDSARDTSTARRRFLQQSAYGHRAIVQAFEGLLADYGHRVAA